MDLCYLSLFLSSSPGNSSVADKLVTQDRQQKPGQPVVLICLCRVVGFVSALLEHIFLPGLCEPCWSHDMG